MPRVYNKRLDKEIPVHAVYIGRGSKWGNPFVVGRDGTRDECIYHYERYLRAKGLHRQVYELRGKDLVCFCSPEPCHGDILIKLANAGTSSSNKTI